jgi:hypothetical protein
MLELSKFMLKLILLFILEAAWRCPISCYGTQLDPDVYSSSSLFKNCEFGMGTSMSQESTTGNPDLVPIGVSGLRKSSRFNKRKSDAKHAIGSHTERILLQKHTELSVLCAKLTCK